MDAQLKQNNINKSNLQSQLTKAMASYNNGTALKSNINELKAEIINIDMAGVEYSNNREAYIKILSLFIGHEISSDAELLTPETKIWSMDINRSELRSFDLQKSIYEVQKKELRSSYLPQLSAFFQGGYGRPTLNIVNNEFGPWYMTGIRLNWSLGELYTMSNNRSKFSINQKNVEVDKETFLFNTRLDLIQQNENIRKYEDMIIKDEESIALRESITQSAEIQLDNGVITTHEYIQKLNAENLSKQTKILHEIQLLQAKYNQKFITGN